MRQIVFATVLAIAGQSTAWAQDLPKSINEPPRGPGTEAKPTLAPVEGRVTPGWEASGQIGGGHGFGLGARAGYTHDRGIYFGASYTHFWGSSIATIDGDQRTSQNIFGGDLGYKVFVFDRRLELRPFVFLGANFRNEERPENRTVASDTGFAMHASGLAAYHIGPAFVSGEVRLMITPTPVQVAAFGGVGLTL
jgi:hypothetical protein